MPGFSVETSDWGTETSCHTGMTNGDRFDDGECEFFSEDGKLAPGMNADPSRFGPEGHWLPNEGTDHRLGNV
jgi:hypothetical protein